MNTLIKKCSELSLTSKKENQDIIRINERIKKEICYNTLSELTDEKLLPLYKECNSVKKEIKTLENTLNKFVDIEIKQKIINDYLLQLIPAGTKGVYRGNKFNEIVKKFILNLKLNSERFEICFEKNVKVILHQKNQIGIFLKNQKIR